MPNSEERVRLRPRSGSGESANEAMGCVFVACGGGIQNRPERPAVRMRQLAGAQAQECCVCCLNRGRPQRGGLEERREGSRCVFT
ncbi:hypothetical protein EYF80_035304 [Liparis tanakae]|uniref:Uncharacterized protein n=1 Tax=Liparis tanakae TaxID=230148 RepID=A0A4Z2GLT5_9TELE|nr:hypothetical protein EYF80_035304 [Liparis tanakae]